MKKLSPVYELREAGRARILGGGGGSSGAKFEKQSKYGGNTKLKLSRLSIIIVSTTLMAKRYHWS